MVYRTGADIVLVLHFLFVLFVVAGAFLLPRFPRIAYLHIPVALWGVFVEVSGRLCPLTILENHWRHSAGQEGHPTREFWNAVQMLHVLVTSTRCTAHRGNRFRFQVYQLVTEFGSEPT